MALVQNLTYSFNQQLQWLNDYHERCQQEIGEGILKPQGKTEAYDWLTTRTAKVTNGASKRQQSVLMMIIIGLVVYINY